MRECVRIRRSDAAETGRGRGGSPRSQREQSAAATRGSSADATRRAEGPSPRADSRAAGRLEGVREGPGRGAAVRGSPEALPGGPSPLPCEATATASAAAPPLLAARPGAVTLRPPVSRGSATKQKQAVRPQVDFAPAEIYADPGVPSSPRWHVAPSQPPEVFSPDPPWEALPPRTPRPSESPPARRPRPAGAVHRRRADFSHLADVLAGGMRGVFLPGDLSGPPLCPSRRLTERTGQSSRAESAASVPGRGGCVIPRSLGPRPPRAPSRARLPRPQSHPQAPPALARPGLTWSPRAALGHVPRGLSKSAW